jgi:hypothetical protein
MVDMGNDTEVPDMIRRMGHAQKTGYKDSQTLKRKGAP